MDTNDHSATLREAAPVGSTVFVETVTPGNVRLFVETGGTHNPVTHRQDNPTGVDHITLRAGSVLDVDSDAAMDTIEGDAGLVGRLGLHLHGATGSLFVGDGNAYWREQLR